jgi:hypothetical protein
MIGQRPPHRLAPFAARLIGGVWRRPWRPHRFAFFQILQHQLELLDLGVELFRRAPKLHPSQLGKLGLILFDPQPSTGQLGPRRCQLGLARGQQGAQLGNLLNGVGGLRHQPPVYSRALSSADIIPA